MAKIFIDIAIKNVMSLFLKNTQSFAHIKKRKFKERKNNSHKSKTQGYLSFKMNKCL